MDEPLYVAKPAWLTFATLWLIGFGLFWHSVMVGVLLSGELFALVMIALGVPIFLLTHALLPRRIEVFKDNLSFVLPFSRWKIWFDEVVEVRDATLRESLFGRGVKFGAVPLQTSTMVLRTGTTMPWYFLFYSDPLVLVSAKNHEAFLHALKNARNRYTASKATM